MKAVFVESIEFTEWVTHHLQDESYAALQLELMQNPEKVDPMPGCGGLRKVRTADPLRGKGKRGGARVIYFYVSEARWFFMLDIYDKNEKEDLTASEKKILSQLVNELKTQARLARSPRKGLKR